jgi:hypothetical protein
LKSTLNYPVHYPKQTSATSGTCVDGLNWLMFGQS